MKLKSSRIAIALAVASISILSGCGASRTNTNTYGAIPGSIAAGGCVPITQAIPFTATNIFFSGMNLRGGMLSYGQAEGQMAIGGGVAGGNYYWKGSDGELSMNIVPVNTGYTQPTGGYYGGYQPTQQTYNRANATGVLKLSQLVINDIGYRYGNMNYNNGYPTTGYPNTGYPNTGYPNTGSNVCVSGVAIDVGVTRGTFFGGVMYLYLNNSQTVYTLMI